MKAAGLLLDARCEPGLDRRPQELRATPHLSDGRANELFEPDVYRNRVAGKADEGHVPDPPRHDGFPGLHRYAPELERADLFENILHMVVATNRDPSG